MTRDEALKHCQAYLDRQLDPRIAAELEQLLAHDAECAQAFENQRQFLSLLGRSSANVKPSADFQQRLRGKLSTAAHSPTAPAAPAPLQVRRSSRWVWYLSAAGAVLAAGVTIAVFAWPEECPYLVACATEHSLVSGGQAKFDLKSSKNSELAEFVAQRTASHLTTLPELLAQLKPVGAGTAAFSSLEGAPKGVFVRYDGAGEPVTMIIHPWAEETPMEMNLQKYQGKEYWATQHHGLAIACWKSSDGKLLCSLVSKRSKDDLLAIASSARDALAVSKLLNFPYIEQRTASADDKNTILTVTQE